MYKFALPCLLNFVIGFLLLSCTPNNSKEIKTEPQKQKTAVDSLYELVVEKHDIVMPKISDMEALRNRLNKKLEELPKEKATLLQREEILATLSLLKKGHDAMFDWMNQFKNLHLDAEFYKKSSTEELLTYLKEEEKKIEEVARLMLEGIDKANSLLGN